MKRSYKRHGAAHTKQYDVWQQMKRRCNNPKSHVFRLYGGRGIKVCKAWQDSYAVFLADMGDRPSDDHQVERIDNDGDYCPENCRWALPKEQSSNRRTNRLLTHDGMTMTVTQWAERIGISSHCIFQRLDRGWPIDRALNQEK